MAATPVLGRRRFLTFCGALGLGFSPLAAVARTRGAGERRLRFHNIHTGESLSTIYWADGTYIPEARNEIDLILRDWRTDEITNIDPRLLDLVHELAGVVDARAPFHVISGYRSPKTNALLRKKSHGVAKKSLHMRGMAVDICLPGRDLRTLRKAALSLRRGGVGFYPKPGFVHVDVGRVRTW